MTKMTMTIAPATDASGKPEVRLGAWGASRLAARASCNPGVIFVDVRTRMIAHWGWVEKFSPHEFVIASTLICARGGLVGHEDLQNLVYGGDPTGGPLDIARSISVIMVRARRKLWLLGIFASNEHGRGWRLSLSRAEEEAA
jgi:DNA-binding response OmpR family regulator